jgi:hypothetical protein
MKFVNIQHYISLLPELSEKLRKLSKESIYLDKNENKWKYINGELCQPVSNSNIESNSVSSLLPGRLNLEILEEKRKKFDLFASTQISKYRPEIS